MHEETMIPVGKRELAEMIAICERMQILWDYMETVGNYPDKETIMLIIGMVRKEEGNGNTL